MDKIDIKDLRIGNWVHCITDNVNHRIDSFGTDDRIEVYGKPWYIYDGKFNVLSDIEPIPLENEILKKNFKRYDMDFEISDSLYISWNKSKEGYKLFTLDNLDNNIHLVYLNYVHQLQNILRDLGIDREITT